MASRHPGRIQADVLRIFDGRSVAGLGDGELLDRFVERRDEPAFEALVNRLGPMVLGVCRRMLSDPHDVDDAFQATFLVLVRRAGSIRDRDLVAPWLHGVAAKVARRARALAIRRAVRERHEDAEPGVEASPVAEWSEVRAAIDEEIGRLPEHHRRPVVLCDVEGLTREEAAARLGWTLNMVRGRLDRARGRLRDRLTRRGLTPSGAWLALAAPPMAPRMALIAMTVRAGLGRSMGAGMVSASVISMSEGVIRMMVFSKAKLAAVAVLSTGVMVAGAGLIAAQGPGESPKPNLAVPIEPARHNPLTNTPDPITPRSAADLNKARIEAAKKRLEQQAAFYEEGRITIDRLIDASKGLVTAEIDAAATKAERVTAARVHYGRVRDVLIHEKAELEVGRATSADVAEAETSLLDAELLLAKQIEADDPKPGPNPGPIIGAVPSAKREAPRPIPSPLAVAIEAFNKKAKAPNINWTQPPLTEDEVIAAIRFWQPNREVGAIKAGVLTNLTPEGKPVEAFKRIAETRELPEGASFEFNGTLDLGGANGTNDRWGDYIYQGAWVTLRVPHPSTKVAWDFPICGRLDRSITLEEAIKREQDSYGYRGNESPQARAVIDDRIQNLRERIKWRDRDKAQTKD